MGVDVRRVKLAAIQRYLNSLSTFGIHQNWADDVCASPPRKTDEIRDAYFQHIHVGKLMHVVCLKKGARAGWGGRVCAIVEIGDIVENPPPAAPTSSRKKLVKKSPAPAGAASSRKKKTKKTVTYHYSAQQAYAESLETVELPLGISPAPIVKLAPGVPDTPVGTIVTGTVLYQPALEFLRRCASRRCEYKCCKESSWTGATI